MSARGGARPEPRRLALWALSAFVTAACGAGDDESTEVTGDAPPSAPETPSPIALFTPWHDVDAPAPYPADAQWYFRHRLAADPSGAALTEDGAAANELRDALRALVGQDPLETEAELRRLESLARRSPKTVAELLAADEERDVRYAAARLLFRLSLDAAESEDRERSGALAAAAADHLRDEAEEVALLMLECLDVGCVAWTTPRLLKTFGQFDNHPLVVVRARAAAKLIRRGNYGGWPILVKVLKEQTPLQDDLHREWSMSVRTAWWKEEALGGVEAAAGHRFESSADATPAAQAAAVERIEAWWEEHRIGLWAAAPPITDPDLITHVRDLILALGTFQLRNVDNAEFLLTRLGPPVAPHLIAALGREASCTQVRRHCLEILGVLMDEASEETRREWVSRITEQLPDADPRIEERALEAIGASKLESVVELLQAHLSRDEPAESEVILRQLAHNPSAKAREVLDHFLESLTEGDDLWIPGAAAHLSSGRKKYLDAFLDVLEGDDLRRANRASVYLSWFTEVDDYAEAGTAEAKRAATAKLRETLEAQLDPP